ncbi:MAG TPA: SDR family NAD(P)-dependent oxidoreductase [Solirubrobacteraceae bacterium]|nr:SDR family NAD(P)-dependent oxidoreductase [Solirubrobacteraceae bacterium]
MDPEAGQLDRRRGCRHDIPPFGVRACPNRPPRCDVVLRPSLGRRFHDLEGRLMEATLAGKSVLVTGANRGLGQALVGEALQRGAEHVYAGTRKPFSHPDPRVTPMILDVTDETQIQQVVGQVESLDVLINNAGVAIYDDLSDRTVLEQHLAVNLFGPWNLTQAFLPLLTRSHGAIVNVVSLAGAAALPIIPSYSVSKAASLSMSQSLRALLAPRGVSVHAVLAGPMNTEMSRGLVAPKASTESVAQAILAAVHGGEDDIFPDPIAATLADSWRTGAVKEMERQNATLVAEPTAD